MIIFNKEINKLLRNNNQKIRKYNQKVLQKIKQVHRKLLIIQQIRVKNDIFI
jgi:hypothetical protein